MLRRGAAVIALLTTFSTITYAGEDEARYTAELELVAATIWRAVTTRDGETLLRHVRPELVDEVRRQLAMPDSGLSCALFDTDCLKLRLAPDAIIRTSVAEFFRSQPNARLRITFLGQAMFGLESPFDLAMLAWVVPGSEADQSFPRHDLRRWGVDHVNTCLIHTRATGWRFHSGAGVFFCGGSLMLKPDAR